jgi:hypothetical protein
VLVSLCSPLADLPVVSERSAGFENSRLTARKLCICGRTGYRDFRAGPRMHRRDRQLRERRQSAREGQGCIPQASRGIIHLSEPHNAVEVVNIESTLYGHVDKPQPPRVSRRWHMARRSVESRDGLMHALQVDEGVYLLSVACRLISVTRHPRGLSLAREKSRPLHKAA